MRTIIIGNSDEDSDWIKKIGNFQEEDLKASKLASQINKKKLKKLKELFNKLTSNDLDLPFKRQKAQRPKTNNS